MLYWKLLERNWEHLYPIHEGVQPHLAKTRFFNTLVGNPDEEGKFPYPEEIEIVDQVETENVHGRLVQCSWATCTLLFYSFPDEQCGLCRLGRGLYP
ncbi:hypothetical protein ACA29_02540 [Lederbergia galactosidilytica]|uniref:Uncharacterized protein n=1 Tax=Lederbergia galactosidilytica TaxID=217031 RepID=A0A0Q9Y7S7_9BACI|nr:hypothetical protein ACA29_02540 [Lederbergia galactosidilytica]